MTDPIAARLGNAVAGRYRIDTALGVGGMAVVFRALDLKHDRPVAIKVLRPEIAQTVGAERFLREIRIAAQLQHPHILGLIDSGRTGDGDRELLYYVMPFVEGESLRQRIDRDGALPVTDTVRILREVADALAKAHRAGVVHRDIKPDNIMLSDGHALVMDFGVARAVAAGHGDPEAGGATAIGVTVGTPQYMAPEQVAADPRADHRADLYALGIVGYEMLAGTPPFHAESPQQVFAAHIARAPEPVSARRSDAPTVLTDAVMRCLEKDPDSRFASAEDLRARFDLISTATAERAALESRPKRWRRAAVVVLGLLLLGVVATLVSRGGMIPDATADDGRSLAVLPLDNLGGDSSSRFLSDGIAEEILSAASRISGLRVAARTSSFALKDRGLTAAEIGHQLRVRHVLEGSLQGSGNMLRIRTRLVDAKSQQEVWSGRFDSDGSNLFALEDSIATAVVAAIAARVGGTAVDARRVGGTSDSAAHSAYLLGLKALRERSSAKDLARAIGHFQAALAVDSNYPQAWAGLASAWAVTPEYGGPSQDVAVPAAQQAVNRALALDSTSAEAWAALGYLRKSYEWDWPGADSAFRRAIAGDPNNATIHQWYGEHLVNVGRFAESASEFRRAQELDPFSAIVQMAAGAGYLGAGNAREGRRTLEQSLVLDPTLWPARFQLLFLDLVQNNMAAARAQVGPLASTLGVDTTTLTTIVNGTIDPASRARAIGLVNQWRDSGAMPSLVVASWYALLHAPDDAVAVLEKAVARREPFMSMIGWWPALRPLANEPKYQALVQQLNLPPRSD